MTNSSSSPSLLNDSAKPYAGHGKTRSLFLFLWVCVFLTLKTYVHGRDFENYRYKEENRNDLLSAHSEVT